MMLKILKMLKNRKGFTLVELMAVIAVIGILAAIVVPKFSNSTDSAKVAQIQADLRTLGAAQTMHYAKDGTYAKDQAALKDKGYLNKPATPPKGKDGKEVVYKFEDTDGEITAVYDGKTYTSFGGEK